MSRLYVRSEAVRRSIVLLCLCVCFLPLAYREEQVGPILAPLTALTVRTTLILIHWIGMEAVQQANLIMHPGGFSYEIYYQCTGFLPAAFLTLSILCYPGHLRLKLLGVVIGLPIMFFLNLVRLVHLYYIGVHSPGFFGVAHNVLWEGFLIAATLGIWMGWMTWSDRRVIGRLQHY